MQHQRCHSQLHDFTRLLLGSALLVGLSALGTAAPAGATPLGLSQGDTIQSISWDALTSVGGDGGAFDVSAGPKGRFSIDGRFTSVDTSPSGSLAQSNVDFRLAMDLNLDASSASGGVASINAWFSSPGSGNTFVVSENGTNILLGTLGPNARMFGNATVNSASFALTGLVTLTGGDPGLVNALGGLGGTANLILSASAFGFSSNTLNLVDLATGQRLFGSNFTMDLSGILTPTNASAFVPEPSSALLVGSGLLVLLALGRRGRARLDSRVERSH